MDQQNSGNPTATGSVGVDRRTAVVGAAALLAAALGAARPARAQEATPAGEEETGGLPPGVSLVELPEIPRSRCRPSRARCGCSG